MDLVLVLISSRTSSGSCQIVTLILDILWAWFRLTI